MSPGKRSCQAVISTQYRARPAILSAYFGAYFGAPISGAYFGDRLHNLEIAGKTPLLISFTSSFGFGTVGVLGVIRTLDDSAVCYDFETVNTGGPGPTVQELKRILRRSGFAPKGF